MNNGTAPQHAAVARCLRYLLRLSTLAGVAVTLFLLISTNSLLLPQGHCLGTECPPEALSASSQIFLQDCFPPLNCSHHDEHCFEKAFKPLAPAPRLSRTELKPALSFKPIEMLVQSLEFAKFTFPKSSIRPQNINRPPSNLLQVTSVVLRL